MGIFDQFDGIGKEIIQKKFSSSCDQVSCDVKLERTGGETRLQEENGSLICWI